MNQHQPSSWGQDTLRLLSRREFPLCAFTGLLPPDLRYGRLRVSPSIQGCPSPRTLTLSQMESLGIRQIGLPPLVTSEDPWSQWPPKKPENRGVGRDPLGSRRQAQAFSSFYCDEALPQPKSVLRECWTWGDFEPNGVQGTGNNKTNELCPDFLGSFIYLKKHWLVYAVDVFPKSLYIRLPSPIPTCNFWDIFTTKSKNTFAVASFQHIYSNASLK